MKVQISILCERLFEERACDLIAVATPGEIQQPSQNEFTLRTQDLARAADILHAIRSMISTAQGTKK